MKPGDHKSLVVWQKAMDLVVETYGLCGRLPREERYALSDQMRRAAVSIPSNIAEGRHRGGEKEFRQFLLVAYGSAAELETQIEIGQRLGFYQANDVVHVYALLEEVMKMLHTLSHVNRA